MNSGRKLIIHLIITGMLVFSGCSAPQDKSLIKPLYLRCEYKVNPLGLEVQKPRLSWNVLAGDEKQRGLQQTAYQILVSGNKKKLLSGDGDLWNSGKVTSDQVAQVVYNGAALTSGIECWWAVRVWDNNDNASNWSEPAKWSMGLLKSDDWSAKWIGFENKMETNLPGATYWRKELVPDHPISRAVVYTSALGDYELIINGKRVGEDYFNPGWPEFRKRIYYHAYDVTGMLHQGSNLLGGILSTGWYAGYIWSAPCNYGKDPKLLVQLRIEYSDGTTQTIGTDNSWKCSYGPLLEADIQQGETYDARLEMPGWDKAGFDDSNWNTPDLIFEVKADSGVYKGQPYNRKLESSPNVTVKVQQEIKPVKMSQPKPGVYIFDLGQNIAGWARISAKGPAGTKIVMRFAGMLNPDRTLYTEYLRDARAIDTYILKGSGKDEVWEPRFTYHGFQFVEITGYPGEPDLDDITGVVCNSDVPKVGSFRCSDERVNTLYSNCVRTLLANLVDLPTGCADRAERLGWCAKGPIVYTWLYTFDMGAFLNKWMVDMADAQSLGASGSYLQVAPIWGDIESPGWSDDGVCVPYGLYKFYGDTRIIENNYKSLTTYINHIERNLTDYLRTGPGYHPTGEKFIGYGDWLAIVEDRELHSDVLNTLWNGWSVNNMAEMAEAIGRNEDALRYLQLLANMKNAFDDAYVSSDGKIKDDIQSEYALGLYFGFIRDDKIPLAVNQLVDDILSKSHTQMRPDALLKNPVIPPGHLTTGFHGTRALLPMLSKYGQNDLAYRLLLKDTYPSWLYCVKNGATSVYERWDTWMPDKGFQDSRMNSFSMPDLMASVIEWLMADVSGINSVGNGFKEILIKPNLGEGLSWAEATYKSINGTIAVNWKKSDDGSFTMQVTIPPNTKATLSVPKNGMDAVLIKESGQLVWSKKCFRGGVEGMAEASEDTDYVNFKVGSGVYDFKVVREGNK
jgi:alpha-L-rhamnosidase